MLDYLISPEQLLQQLNNENLCIVDCRFVLGKPDEGFNSYREAHIPGAMYLDLEKDLSAPVQAHGGRHPLPHMQTFGEKISSLGIDQETTIVAYDDQGGAMASRLWWLMQYVGHRKTYILNGTFTTWKENGYPTTQDVPIKHRSEFHLTVQPHMLASMEEVKSKLAHPEVLLIDAREPNRYKGLEEPIDPIAGHIPNAVNYFWKSVLNEGILKDTEQKHVLFWKSPAQLQQHFQAIDSNKEIIVYCGSGVTACPNILALQQAGFANVKLYAGSWSDWISYPDNPIASSTSNETQTPSVQD